MKHTKHCLKMGEEEKEYNGGGKHILSMLHVCIELSQWSPLVLLMYAHSKLE
jgi:hypothetical protein